MTFKLCIIFLLSVLPCLHSLTSDGLLLLSFKYSLLADPLNALRDWNLSHPTPCQWNGVICTTFQPANQSRLISLVLPNSNLFGPLAPELAFIQHLRHLDLSGNALNGTIPSSLFNATELRTLDLAGNRLAGTLPEFNYERSELRNVDLSGNALSGEIPASLTLLPELTSLSLANNYISGELPSGGFAGVEFLDLSSNLINGSVPRNFVFGRNLRFLNLSYNRLSGEIPSGLRVAGDGKVDFSYNNLTGAIPQSFRDFSSAASFAGNDGLCGPPLRRPCAAPASVDGENQPSMVKSPPAFAAMPKVDNGDAKSVAATDDGDERANLRPAAIIAIAVGDVAGVGVLLALFVYVYQVKRRRDSASRKERSEGLRKGPGSSPEPNFSTFRCCFGIGRGEANGSGENSENSQSESEVDKEEIKHVSESAFRGNSEDGGCGERANLVTVDGEGELEVETLLKASAYILGATGASIVYKAVLADGTALAVRRIGETSVLDKMKEFEGQVRGIAKFRHPNLLRIRGFYWGPDEKLLIHDFAPNGSLGNISFSKRFGASSVHLSWETRLRIARGVARGLSYLHDKKSLHGNLKPNNILLDEFMEPKIADFGLDKLIKNVNPRLSSSGRQFGSKRSMRTSISLPDLSQVAAGAVPCGSSSVSPYIAPECLKNSKPNAKWDVYSFGMVLLELVAGRVFSPVELCQWNYGFIAEERSRIARMSDPTIRGEIEGKEDAVLCCFRLGFACCTMAPQRRPSMKEAFQILEKIASSSSSSY